MRIHLTKMTTETFDPKPAEAANPSSCTGMKWKILRQTLKRAVRRMTLSQTYGGAHCRGEYHKKISKCSPENQTEKVMCIREYASLAEHSMANSNDITSKDNDLYAQVSNFSKQVLTSE